MSKDSQSEIACAASSGTAAESAQLPAACVAFFLSAKNTSPKTDLLDPAIEGTLNVLRQAQKVGITKVIITSSFAAVNNFKAGGIRRDYTYTEADWNPATFEEAAKPDCPGAYAYSASKK